MTMYFPDIGRPDRPPPPAEDDDADEAVRIARLQGYGLLNAVPDPDCERLAALAAEMFDMPICQISVIGPDTLWVKGVVGLEQRLHPRSTSFCTHVLTERAPMIVPDATSDPRFCDHEAVVTTPGVRFYAGTPIMDEQGMILGVFCVVDVRPRPDFDVDDERLLIQLATIVGARFGRRRAPHILRSLEGYIEAVDTAFVTTDAEGRITSFNPAAERIFGQDRWRMIGRPLSDILPDGLPPADIGARDMQSMTGLRSDGVLLALHVSAAAWDGVAGMEQGVQIRKVATEGPAQAPGRDSLTGLLDTNGFRQCAARHMDRDGAAALLLIHLDGLKPMNDLLGHDAGDRLLRIMARRLASVRKDGDVIGRIGGARFAMLIGSDRGWRQDAMLDDWRRPVRVGDHMIAVPLSIGLAEADGERMTAKQQEERAAIALHCARQEGGDCVRTFDRRMAERVEQRRRLKDALRMAHVEGEFMLHYQPQFRLSDSALIGAEALLRWNVPGQGVVMPDRFMAVLETHLIAYDVGCWIIETVCAQIARWRAEGLGTVPVAVNLFPAQVTAGTLAAVLDAAIGRYGLAPGDIEIEITERVALDGAIGREDAPGGTAQFDTLRSLGYGIAFDDFGTGFASLASLKQLPFTRLKIDRSFVQDMNQDPHSHAIIHGTIAIAHGLGARVIAEGIETPEQAKALRGIGCDEGQGFHYARPEAAAVFAERLLRVTAATA